MQLWLRLSFLSHPTGLHNTDIFNFRRLSAFSTGLLYQLLIVHRYINMPSKKSNGKINTSQRLTKPRGWCLLTVCYAALGQESSTDRGSSSAGSTLIFNSLRQDSELLQDKLGLTPEGRVDPAQIISMGPTTSLMRLLAKADATFSRTLDWTNGPQDLLNGLQVNSAIGQQIGPIAPEGEECNHCHFYEGTFKSCVVFAYNLRGSPKLMYRGACMNCHFSSTRGCSLSVASPVCSFVW